MRDHIITKYYKFLGAGGGIGRQLSLEFAVHGAKLVLWDINKGNILVPVHLLS